MSEIGRDCWNFWFGLVLGALAFWMYFHGTPTMPRWFHAYDHMDELLAYARSWCGERAIHALDAFGYSGTIALLGGCSDVGQGWAGLALRSKTKEANSD